MASTLRQLLNILTESVTIEVLELRCAATGTSIPDLNVPSSSHSEAFRVDPEAARAAMCASAAALHIQAILSPPHISLYHTVSGPLKATALRICLESNVTEILREAGPEYQQVVPIACRHLSALVPAKIWPKSWQARAVSSPHTRLISLENIVLPTCHDPGAARSIPGYAPSDAPTPLLANYGAANGMTFIIDMIMFVVLNTQERTIAHLEALLESTGWKLVRVRGDTSNFMQSIEAIPV